MVRVLICDPDRDYLGLLKRSFERHGLSASTASGLEEARLMLENQDFDLVLSEAVFEDATRGIALFHAVREKLGGVPFWFASGPMEFENEIEDAVKNGAAGLIKKPALRKDLFKNCLNDDGSVRTSRLA